MAQSRARAPKKQAPPRRRPTAPSRINIAPGPNTLCREAGCSSLATTLGYCRAHYIKNWATIKRKDALIREGRLRKFIEELVEKYPESVIQAVRRDLSTDESLEAVSRDLGLDEWLRLGLPEAEAEPED